MHLSNLADEIYIIRFFIIIFLLFFFYYYYFGTNVKVLLFSEIQSYGVCSLYAKQCWIHPIRDLLRVSAEVLVCIDHNDHITLATLWGERDYGRKNELSLPVE